MLSLVVLASSLLAQAQPPDAGAPAAEPATIAAPTPPPIAVVPEPDHVAAETSQPVETVRVSTRDGMVVTGVVEQRTSDTLKLKLASGARIDIPLSAIEDETVVADAKPLNASGWFDDPNRTRYLYGPSAMMLKKGEMYFSQSELILSTFSIGITDWLSGQIGAAIPLWFITPIPSGFNLVFALKVGAEVAPKVSLAAGVQSLIIPGVGSGGPRGSGVPLLGLAFGSATYGTHDAHVTLTGGVPFGINGLSGLTGSPIVTLSGNLRVSRAVALVTENWLIVSGIGTAGAGFVLADALAARIMTEHIAVDLGLLLVNLDGTFVPFPIPWLQFAYNFGG